MNDCRESKERRIEIFEAYKQIPNSYHERVGHSFLKYDRYHEAELLIQHLEAELNDRFCVVDFGCGVGDYGFAFGRQGCMVLFFDIEPIIHFVNFRLSYEHPPFGHLTIPNGQIDTPGNNLSVPEGGCQLAIFGEVLEHIIDPDKVLQKFTDAGTKYLFTSSYPYRSDSPEDPYWKQRGHIEEARVLQPACRTILETNYDKVAHLGGEAYIWRNKKYV